jgi:hypothetical protein
MKYPFLQRNSAKKKKKKNYGMSVTLGDKRPSYYTVKNLVVRFRTRHLSAVDEEPSGRPTTVTIPENVDAIHDPGRSKNVR